MKKPTPMQLTVVGSQQVTPNMQRVFLKGDALADFPLECEGSYIKFLFDAIGNTDLSAITDGSRPVMRTYTIRRFSPSTCAIEVDFVRHMTQDNKSGFATRWAMSAKVGDKVCIAGPGKIKEINTDTDWVFMVADMTALPALSTKLRQLSDEVKGYAVIKVAEVDDIQKIDLPKNVQLIWLTESQSLSKSVKSLPWLDGKVSIWAACEFDDMRELRQYFKNEKEVAQESIYISSYWKKGVTEDGHKAFKQLDAKKER